MTKSHVKIRYDGDALSDHSMDVHDLAPALLAVADICKIANKKFNGDGAAIQVVVNANLEQNYFELNLQLVQSVYDQAMALIKDEDIANAKELLEWIGIIGGSCMGLFGLYKLLTKSPENKEKLIFNEEGDQTIINIDGNNNFVEVHPEAYKLMQDEQVFNNVKKNYASCYQRRL